MTALYVCNLLALITTAWAVWIRRHSFESRWDRPLTVGVALYVLASALDTPWPTVAAASFPLTGKHYLFNTLGQICYLAGNAAGLKAVFHRLLPDDQIEHFMRTRVVAPVGVAASVMLVCVVASPQTSVMPADFLYAVPLDGWLRVYFCVFFLTMVATLGMAVFGGIRLAQEPPGAGPALPLLGTASVGSLASLGFLALILTGRNGLVLTLWPLAYLGTSAAAVTCAVMWRHRIAQLSRRRQESD